MVLEFLIVVLSLVAELGLESMYLWPTPKLHPACGIIPDHGIEPKSHTLQADSSPLAHQGGSI